MNTKIVMTAAWTIARRAASKFGGSTKQYISGAMKTAWELFRKPMTQKQIVKLLDDMAGKGPSRKAASAKQTWYLAGLMAAKWELAAVQIAAWTVKPGYLAADRASDLINEYK